MRQTLATFVFVVMIWVPVLGFAAEPGTISAQDAKPGGAQPQSGSAAKSVPKENAANKPNHEDVQSRGLFQKKKKKQVGGSAGHSQPAEQSDAQAR